LITYLIVSNQQRKQETDMALQQSQQAQSTATDAQTRANQHRRLSNNQWSCGSVDSTTSCSSGAGTDARTFGSDDTIRQQSLDASVANLNLETDVTLKLSDDKELVMYALTAKATNGNRDSDWRGTERRAQN